jgi:hypothetical protein
MRAIGIADLALVPGLLTGRPRWPWVAARAGLNLTIAAFLVASRPCGQTPRPLAAAAALIAVTMRDMRVAATLRAVETDPGAPDISAGGLLFPAIATRLSRPRVGGR